MYISAHWEDLSFGLHGAPRHYKGRISIHVPKGAVSGGCVSAESKELVDAIRNLRRYS